MNDLTDLERELAAVLADRAAAAAPRSLADAWQQIAASLPDDPVGRGEVGDDVVDVSLKDLGRSSRPRALTRRRRLVVVLAAAAVAVVVVGLGLVLHDRSDPGGVPADTVPERDVVFGPSSAMYGVASNGSLLVAVGTDSGGFDLYPDADASAAVWTSTDGMKWTRVPHDEDVFGGPDGQAMWDVTPFQGGFVAVGVDQVDKSVPGGTSSAAAWTSDDGLRWTRVAHDETFAGEGRQELRSIAASGDRLVAIGFDEADQGLGRSNEDTAIWTSSDAVTWERVRAGFGTGWIETVLAAEDGFVGIGVDNGRAVWTSTDGVSWTKAVASPPENQVQLRRTIRLADGYLGTSFDGDLWESTDGLEWTMSAEARTFDDGTIFALANHQGGFVAVGIEGQRGASAATARPLDLAGGLIGVPNESQNLLISSERWSIVALSSDAESDVEAVLSDVSGWDAVVDIATIDASWQAWAAFGIDACAGDVRLPCGAGLVVLTETDDEIPAVAQRLIDDHDLEPLMNPSTAENVVDRYIEALSNREAARSAPPENAVEQPLSGPLEPWEPFPVDSPLYSVVVRLDDRNAVFWIAPSSEDVGHEAGPVVWVEQSQQRDEMFGRGTANAVMAQPERGLVVSQRDSGYVAIGGLPVAASTVVAEDEGGRRVWQEPTGGIALLDVRELPGAVVTVLGQDGQELFKVHPDGGGGAEADEE